MLPYILVALFPLAVECIYSEHLTRSPAIAVKRRWLYLLVATLPLFIMIGIRGANIGADTGVYILHFESMVHVPLGEALTASDTEVGYIVFVKLIGMITDDPNVYQVICASVYFLGVYTFANQLEKSPFLFLVLFATMGLFTFMFTGVRQCIAMSICLMSFYFIRRRKLIPFVLVVLLAFTFHKSAILFLISYFIYNRKINTLNFLLYGGFATLSVLYLENIQDFFNNALDYDYEIESTGTGYLFFALLVVLVFFGIVFLFSYKTINKESQGLANVAIIAVFLWILRLFTRVAERPSFYFLFFACALIAFSVDAIKDFKHRCILKFVILSACIFLYVYRLSGNTTLLPYYTFF